MTHLMLARRANLLLAGSSFQISTVSQKTIQERQLGNGSVSLVSRLLSYQSDTSMREMDCLVPADFLLLQLVIWVEPRITPLLALRAEHSLSPEFTSVGSDCPGFSCCPLVLCCAVCHVSSFSCLLSSWMRCKSECWTVSSNMRSRSGRSRNCSKSCQQLKTLLRPEMYWSHTDGCQISEDIGPFAYLKEQQT